MDYQTNEQAVYYRYRMRCAMMGVLASLATCALFLAFLMITLKNLDVRVYTNPK